MLLGLLFGLLAGVGAFYARTQATARATWPLPTWMYGVAAALATAGIAATLTALVPASMPTWPDLKRRARRGRGSPRLTGGLSRCYRPSAITLFLLAAVDRGTAGWTRRLPLAALVLVLLGVAVAILVRRADRARGSRRARSRASTTFAFAWLVLRFDLRTVPAFVAHRSGLDAIEVRAARRHGVRVAVARR